MTLVFCLGIFLANGHANKSTSLWVLLLAIFAWIAFGYFIIKTRKIVKKDRAFREDLDNRRLENIKILRATLDEIIAIRNQFIGEGSSNQKVRDYLNNASP